MTNGKGSKKMYGLLGKNINYSLSPFMHNAAFKRFDIPAEYRLFDIKEKDLDAFFQELISGGDIKGINVTVPYKIKVKEMLDACQACSVNDEVKILGAVNTVKAEKSGLIGYNTDGEGFYEALMEVSSHVFNPLGKDVFVLGAGGAGRTICLYLAFLGRNKPNSISVFDVDKRKLSELKASFDAWPKSVAFYPVESADHIPDRIEKCNLVVNATPLGTKEGDPLPVDPDLLDPNAAVCDLVYARDTELCQEARTRGNVAINGMKMLVNQAALAFRIWTREPIEEIKNVMEGAVKKTLKGLK